MIRSIRYGLATNYAAMLSLAITVNLLPVFLTTLSHELGGAHGLTNEQLGRLAGIMFVGLVAGVLVTAPIADRWGPKPFALGGNALVSAGLVALGLAPDYAGVSRAVFVMGAGAGVLDMVLSPIVCALQPHRRTAAMNWLHSFYCIGAVITVMLGSVALRWGLGWRALSFGLALVPAFVTVAFAFMAVPTLVKSGDRRARLRDLIRTPFFLAALAAIFLGGAAEAGLAQWLPAYAETTLGYSKWVGGLSLVFFSLVMAIGRICLGLMGNRISPYTVLLACCASSAVLFVACSLAPWPGMALAACVAVGVAASGLWPGTLGVAADRFPRGGASMFGLLTAFGNLGCVFMPWLVGAVGDLANLRWGMATVTLCPLLLAVLILWMRRQEQGEQAGRG